MRGGSGCWLRSYIKSTTDAECCLSITSLKKSGCLLDGAYGSIKWSQCGDGPSISFRVSDDHLLLNCDWKQDEDEGPEAKQIVKLERQPCYLGGFRTYFRCPGCGRRTSALYFIGGIFRCRQCHGLTYRSQQSHKIDRLISRIDKIYGKLGVDNPDPFSSIPRRPKGMHRSTYLQLRMAAINAKSELSEEIIKRFGFRNYR